MKTTIRITSILGILAFATACCQPRPDHTPQPVVKTATSQKYKPSGK